MTERPDSVEVLARQTGRNDARASDSKTNLPHDAGSSAAPVDSKTRHDRWLALIVLVFCAVAGRLCMDLPSDATGTTLGPNFFPWAMVIGLAILGVTLLLRALWRAREPAEGAHRTGGAMLLKLGFFVVLMLVYTAAYIPVGYLGSTMGFFVIAMLALGERRPLHVLVIPAAVVLSIYLVFTVALKVYLP
jgi:putative tricarboxylic transport membrane protein